MLLHYHHPHSKFSAMLFSSLHNVTGIVNAIPGLNFITFSVKKMSETSKLLSVCFAV